MGSAIATLFHQQTPARVEPYIFRSQRSQRAKTLWQHRALRLATLKVLAASEIAVAHVQFQIVRAFEIAANDARLIGPNH
jgi:hypothetical protein